MMIVGAKSHVVRAGHFWFKNILKLYFIYITSQNNYNYIFKIQNNYYQIMSYFIICLSMHLCMFFFK